MMTLSAHVPPAFPGNDPFTWAEIERIVSLEVVHPMTAAEQEEFNKMRVQADALASGFRLNADQCNAVATYEVENACFAKVGVGQGKTLISLMCAAAAYRKGLRKMLLLVPPEVISQLTITDIPWARSRVEINYPIHILGGKSSQQRINMCKSGYKGLYVMPYSLLSTKDTSENLHNLLPELVIADEAHRLARASSARTRRFLSMLKFLFDHKTPAELLILSGTITSKSIKDYYHLIKWCLNQKCPLPLSDSMTNDWAMLIDAAADSEANGLTPAAAAPIKPLVRWAAEKFPETEGGFPSNVYGFRRAYQCRLTSAPGVVTSTGTTIGTSLIMKNSPVPEHDKHPEWPKLKELIDKVEDMWLTPNGDEIDFEIHKWKWINELSCGFYNELTWPTVEVLAKRRKTTEQEATDLLFRAKIHHQAGQLYARELRIWLEDCSKAGCDTPFLVGQHMMRNGSKEVGEDLYKWWKEWKDLDFDGRPDRDSRGVRVCDYKIVHAVAWARQQQEVDGHGGIIWVHHQEVGAWLADRLIEGGLDVLHATAGENRAILDHANVGKIVVASIDAHGTGKNLQHFQYMMVFQWPRDARKAEQLVGRLHRQGQTADELEIVMNHTLLFDMLNFAACINDALYIHQSTQDRQKLIYANYDPLPRIFSDSVLVERGLDAQRLDRFQKQMLAEKFGSYEGR